MPDDGSGPAPYPSPTDAEKPLASTGPPNISRGAVCRSKTPPNATFAIEAHNRKTTAMTVLFFQISDFPNRVLIQ